MDTISIPRKTVANPRWFWVFMAAVILYVTLPFMAPVFMAWGWEPAGRLIYLIYSFLCHQLPQRSYFLFGEQLTYPLTKIQLAAGVINPQNILALRQFIGNPQMGWKVAWSDRMVAMFTSIPLFALLWYPLRRHFRPLPWWGLALLLTPMMLDGSTHFISDLAGIGLGFRETNLWLAVLTHNFFEPAFYNGDALGSFNSILRLLSGILFGLGMVWFGFPYLEDAFQ